MGIKDILNDEFGFIHVDTRHIAKDISLKMFVLSNRKVYSPLPTFDVLALDKMLLREETVTMMIDWVLTKTVQSKRCILVCLVRPRNLSLTSVLSMMEHTSDNERPPPPPPSSSDVNTPQDPISRALIESLRGHEADFGVVVQEQVISEEEVFTHFCIQIRNTDNRESFVIDGKKWVATLKKTLHQVGLTPSVAEIVDIPISEITAEYRKWHEFILFLKMRRRNSGMVHASVDRPSGIKCLLVPTTPAQSVQKDIQNHSRDQESKDSKEISEFAESPTCNTTTDKDTLHNEQQPQRNPGWKGWAQGIAVGILFGSLPLWHLMSEF